MYKETITYIDYDGNERTEEVHFNLNKAEVLELEMKENGGLSKLLNKLIAEQDQKKIVEIFKEIVFKAYGEKSNDGRRFIKSEELSIAFSQTEAYSEIFTRLALDEEYATKFINAIIPQQKE